MVYGIEHYGLLDEKRVSKIWAESVQCIHSIIKLSGSLAKQWAFSRNDDEECCHVRATRRDTRWPRGKR